MAGGEDTASTCASANTKRGNKGVHASNPVHRPPAHRSTHPPDRTVRVGTAVFVPGSALAKPRSVFSIVLSNLAEERGPVVGVGGWRARRGTQPPTPAYGPIMIREAPPQPAPTATDRRAAVPSRARHPSRLAAFPPGRRSTALTPGRPPPRRQKKWGGARFWRPTPAVQARRRASGFSAGRSCRRPAPPPWVSPGRGTRAHPQSRSPPSPSTHPPATHWPTALRRSRSTRACVRRGPPPAPRPASRRGDHAGCRSTSETGQRASRQKGSGCRLECRRAPDRSLPRTHTLSPPRTHTRRALTRACPSTPTTSAARTTTRPGRVCSGHPTCPRPPRSPSLPSSLPPPPPPIFAVLPPVLSPAPRILTWLPSLVAPPPTATHDASRRPRPPAAHPL